MKRNHFRCVVPLAATLTSLLAGCGFLPKQAADIRAAIWVTRFDYRTEADVRGTLRNCAQAGFDTVLFQVRGNGTVLYRSNIEPWFEGFGWRDPGFDPLAVACDEARLLGIELQAWVNACPGWRGDRPPDSERQLYHTHPDWFVVDQDRKRQPLRKNRYVMLNPCLPEVRAYIARVCEEIALRYPVDGIHLDYIRFADKEQGRDYPYDHSTLELFREATGKTPAEDERVWYDWRTAQITELVRTIRRAVRRANRRCMLTAAVYPTPSRGQDVHQDWPAWLEHGLVDAVFPMTYDTDDARFAARISSQAAASAGRPVLVGIGAYKHSNPEQTLRQIREVQAAGLQGYSLFAYSSFFKSRANAAGKPEDASIRIKRRDRILPRIQRLEEIRPRR